MESEQTECKEALHSFPRERPRLIGMHDLQSCGFGGARSGISVAARSSRLWSSPRWKAGIQPLGVRMGCPPRSSGRADSQSFPQSPRFWPGSWPGPPSSAPGPDQDRAVLPGVLAGAARRAPLSLLGCPDPSGSQTRGERLDPQPPGCSELGVFPQSICEREVALPPGCADINPLANNKWINNNKV